MTRSLLSIACHEYGIAAAVYLVYLIRQWSPLPVVGRFLVASGMLAHAASLGFMLVDQWGFKVGITQGFSLLTFVLVAIFLGLDLRYRKPVLGSFLMPVAVTLLTTGMLLPAESGALSPEMRRPLLLVHTVIAVLGMAASAVAAGVAVMYLLMDRQMKGKKFGVLFSRLPSLQFLDELNRRLVVWGFIALSLTLVTGAFFASGQEGLFWEWRSKEIATLVAWSIFASMLTARIWVGWQGRKVALLTMAGFCVLLVSFLSTYQFGAQGVGSP